jgi:hypothetical protein
MDLLENLNDQSLSLLEKLNDEQRSIAQKVIAESLKQRVNPNFSLPLVMQESGFNPDAKSPKGAFGVMQLMPETAKGLKVDPSDVDQNISGGIKLIKELSQDKRIGNDPIKLLIGYNTGTETRNRALEEGIDALPEETIAYIDDIANHVGGNLPSVLMEDKQKSESKDKSELKTESESKIDPREIQEFGQLGYLGGSALGVTKIPVFKAGKKAFDWATTSEKSALPIALAESAKTHGGENWGKELTGVDIPGAQMNKESLKEAQRLAQIVGRHGEPGFQGGQIIGGIAVPPELRPRNVEPEGTFQKIQALLKYGSLEQKEFAKKLLTNAKKNIGTVGGFGSIGMGAGMSIPQAAVEYQRGNTEGALKTLGTGMAGGAMMAMAPKAAPAVSAILGPLDVYRRMTEDDPTGAGISAFGTIAPLAALALTGPFSLPLAAAAAFAPTAINAYRDYRRGSFAPTAINAYRDYRQGSSEQP